MPIPHRISRIAANDPISDIGPVLFAVSFPRLFGSSLNAWDRSNPNQQAGNLSVATLVVINQNPVRGTVHVIILSASHRPKKRQQAEPAHAQRNWYQDQKAGQFAVLNKRRELPTTRSELPDMAMAATSGVTSPASASGTASKL